MSTNSIYERKYWNGNKRLISDLLWSGILSFFFHGLASPSSVDLLTATFVLLGGMISIFFTFFFWSWNHHHLKCRVAKYSIFALFSLLQFCALAFLIVTFSTAGSLGMHWIQTSFLSTLYILITGKFIYLIKDYRSDHTLDTENPQKSPISLKRIFWTGQYWNGNKRLLSDLCWSCVAAVTFGLCFKSLSIFQGTSSEDILIQAIYLVSGIPSNFFFFFFWSWNQYHIKYRAAKNTVHVLFCIFTIVHLYAFYISHNLFLFLFIGFVFWKYAYLMWWDKRLEYSLESTPTHES